MLIERVTGTDLGVKTSDSQNNVALVQQAKVWALLKALQEMDEYAAQRAQQDSK